MLTEQQVKNAINKANELSTYEELINKRMAEIIKIIRKETKSIDSWWDWNYTRDDSVEVPIPWEDLTSEMSVYIDRPSELLEDCDLYEIPGEWLWTDDTEIKKQIQKIISDHKQKAKKQAAKQKEYREKKKKLDAALKKEEKKLKAKLGIQ